MKSCKDCKLDKPISEYSVSKTTKDKINIICKSCAVARSTKWRAANKERANERYRKHYAENSERYKEKGRIRNRAWYLSHQEEQKQRSKEYRIAHPEVKRVSENKRRTAKAGGGTFFILPKEITKLLSSNCSYCGTAENVTLDHIVPISRGGKHSIGNLQSLCGSCNSSKNAKTIMEWRVARGALR